MFEYEWENSSHMLLQPTVDDDASNGASHDGLHHLHRQTTAEEAYSGGGHVDASSFMSPTFLPFAHHNSQNNPYHGFQTVMDPRAFASASYSHAPQSGPSSMLSSADYDSAAAAAFFSTFPKTEPGGQVSDCNNHHGGSSADLDRIGLNLGFGGRTYFSAADEDFLSRLYRRSRPFDGGIGGSLVANSPKCQAEGCDADLSNAKHYHRRHKVCEFHSKASTVVAGGLTQRFCQQCSRFHLLTEFDNGKRSCRRRLADHNRRRRKSHQANASQDRRSLQAENLAGNSSGSENPSKSPSRAHSVSSVTVAVSPSMQESKLNCYSSSASPQASSSSIFY